MPEKVWWDVHRNDNKKRKKQSKRTPAEARKQAIEEMHPEDREAIQRKRK